MSRRYYNSLDSFEIAGLAFLVVGPLFALVTMVLLNETAVASTVMALIVWAGAVLAFVRRLNRRDDPRHKRPPPDTA
jgi:hypothetical protein